MSLWDDLLAAPTIAATRNVMVGFAQGAGLEVTAWEQGDVAEQILETVVLIAFTFTRPVVKIARGYASLDTSADPGDPDDFDAENEGKPAAPGLLSNFGENTFGTVREGETFANGFVTFTNGGIVARSFGPDSLTFTWTNGSPPSPAPTYRNSADASIYVNADGTVTVGAGSSLDIPVTAEEIGTGSNAPPGALSLTTALLGCTATNAEAVLGTDRESADLYRTRCKQAGSRLSLGGPGGAYAYLAAKNLDGTPLINAAGDPVSITRTYESPESPTGIVDVFYASDAGAAISDDVTAANQNIEAEALAVFDCITFTGLAAMPVSIHVAGTAKIKNKPGVTIPAVQAAIVAALTEAFKAYPIGGVDQVAGAGVLYTADFQAVAAGAYPGLYDVLVTTPAGASTALALGQVATLNSVAGDWTVTLV